MANLGKRGELTLTESNVTIATNIHSKSDHNWYIIALYYTAWP